MLRFNLECLLQALISFFAIFTGCTKFPNSKEVNGRV